MAEKLGSLIVKNAVAVIGMICITVLAMTQSVDSKIVLGLIIGIVYQAAGGTVVDGASGIKSAIKKNGGPPAVVFAALLGGALLLGGGL